MALTLWKYKEGKQNPEKTLLRITETYGPPDIIDKEEGGLAIWNCCTIRKKTSHLYHEIMIRDESIKHSSHVDYLYTSVILKSALTKQQFMEIYDISPSLYYVQLERKLVVRCHFIGANIITLYLALAVQNGLISIVAIKEKKLYEIYIEIASGMLKRKYDSIIFLNEKLDYIWQFVV